MTARALFLLLASCAATLDADAVVIPEHHIITPLPSELRSLKVRVTVHPQSRMEPAVEDECLASARARCRAVGWLVVDDDSADLEAQTACHGSVNSAGRPVSGLNVVQDDRALEFRLPSLSVPQLQLLAHGTPIASIPAAARHRRCNLPPGPQRTRTCAMWLDQDETARLASLLAASPQLAAFAHALRH